MLENDSIVFPEFSSNSQVQDLILKGDAFKYFEQLTQALYYYDEALKLEPDNEVALKGKDYTFNRIQEIEIDLDELRSSYEDQKTVSVPVVGR